MPAAREMYCVCAVYIYIRANAHLLRCWLVQVHVPRRMWDLCATHILRSSTPDWPSSLALPSRTQRMCRTLRVVCMGKDVLNVKQSLVLSKLILHKRAEIGEDLALALLLLLIVEHGERTLLLRRVDLVFLAQANRVHAFVP